MQVDVKESKYDQLVDQRVIQKCLESDDLIIMDGPDTNNKMQLDSKMIEKEIIQIEDEDNVSAGDFRNEYKEKIYLINRRKAPK